MKEDYSLKAAEDALLAETATARDSFMTPSAAPRASAQKQPAHQTVLGVSADGFWF